MLQDKAELRKKVLSHIENNFIDDIANTQNIKA